jgi:hypothetical protein
MFELTQLLDSRELSSGTITEDEIFQAMASLPVLYPSLDSMKCSIAIQEDLSNGQTALWTPVSGDWSVRAEALWQTDPDVYGYASTGYYGTWEDIDISAEINFNSFNKSAGILLRATDAHNCYKVELTEETIEFYVLVDNTVISHQSVSIGQEIDKDEWHTLRVQSEGNRFNIYLDGDTPVMAVMDLDNIYTAGDTYLYTDHCLAGFRDIEINTVTDMQYVSQREILGTDLNGDGEITYLIMTFWTG